MLTERSIINFLIWIAGLIAAPYLAVATLYGNFTPLLAVAGVGFLLFIFGSLQDRICLLPLFGSFIQGRLNFLPFRLAPSDVFGVAVIIYYIITYTALQRKLMKTGPMFFFIPILVIASIVLYHEHNFGLRAMGEGREGARGALYILLSSVAYLCGVSVNSPSPFFLIRAPFYCVVIAVISAVPYTLSTYFPGLDPLLVLFTSDLNSTAINVNSEDAIVRNSGLSAAASTLMLYLMCYYPVRTWFRPERWWMLIVGIISTFLVINGGFRSAVALFGVTIFAATWCHYTWRAFVIVPPMIFAIFLLTAVQDSHVVHLPNAAQRSLAFLPGDWDPEVMSTTESSNDFRQKIKDVYIREDLANSPFFGNGFSYDTDEFEKMNYLALTQETADGYYSTKIFVTGKMFHIGWISLYDSVGLVGSAAFLFFSGSLIWVLGREITGQNVDRSSPFFPLKVWMLCSTVPSLIGYFTVFGDFKEIFPGFCYFVILWTHVRRLEKYGYLPERSSVGEVSFESVQGGAPMSV